MVNEDTEVVERIASDFIEGNGPYMYCSKRDDDCYATPFFGYGESDAEVMVVAGASGGTKTISEADQHRHNNDRKRRWKNYRETGEKHNKEIDKNRLQLQPIKELPIDAGGLPSRLAEEFSVYFTNSVKCGDI